MGRIATLVVLAVLACPAAAGARTAILPLGDSITYGSSLNVISTPGGYRGMLGEELDAAGLDHTFVGTSTANPPLGALLTPGAFAHDGWPGARIDQIADALDGPSPLDGGHWLTTAGVRPDVVIVHLGTNDINQYYDPGTTYPGGYNSSDPAQRAEFVDHMIGRLHGLVDKIRADAPNAKIVLCTIVPMYDPTAAAYSEAIRSRLVPALRAAGVPVALADVERAFASGGRGLIGPDGVHPLSAGYVAMTGAIEPAVAGLIRRSTGRGHAARSRRSRPRAHASRRAGRASHRPRPSARSGRRTA
ncbi:MAG: hypothetical protein QOF76_1923 [Solirubrobacteraceae bacterium]|jgi:lysophospholipase L1-like esterase|nr:hypothetical protein [Solirubrobacteraceae bacterium]